MTRFLIASVGRVHSSSWVGAVALLGVLLALLPLALLVDIVADVLRAARVARVAATTEVSCPHGHWVSLVGAWTCESCRQSYEGHAFLPHAPGACDAVPYSVTCPCGLSAGRNPLWKPRP